MIVGATTVEVPAVTLPSTTMAEGVSCSVDCCHEDVVVIPGVSCRTTTCCTISFSTVFVAAVGIAPVRVWVSGEPGVITMPVGNSFGAM